MALIEDTRIVSQLFGYNPWWVAAGFDESDFRRVAFRPCYEQLRDRSSRRAVLLSGPRRVGKSTILRQTAQQLVSDGVDPKGILYVSMDDPVLKLAGLDRVLEVYRSTARALGQETYLLLDEVQYAAEWDLHIKRIVDHEPATRVLATGSACVATDQGAVESGVGRWVTVRIHTLSFFEYLQITGQTPATDDPPPQLAALFESAPAALSEIAAVLRPVMPKFFEYLLVGGFPETAQLGDLRRSQRLILEDITDKVLKRDMTALFKVRNPPELERLFVYLCLNTGGIVNTSTVASQLGITRPTLETYLGHLVQANLVYRVSQYPRGPKQALKSQRKYYLVDAGIRNSVLRVGTELFEDPEDLGHVVETTALRHVLAYSFTDLPEITYWREPRTDHEVDFVYTTPRVKIPFEIKFRDGGGEGIPTGLAEFCRQELPKRAYVVTRKSEDFRVVQEETSKSKILRVPAHVFTYLLGASEFR